MGKDLANDLRQEKGEKISGGDGGEKILEGKGGRPVMPAA